MDELVAQVIDYEHVGLSFGDFAGVVGFEGRTSAHGREGGQVQQGLDALGGVGADPLPEPLIP